MIEYDNRHPEYAQLLALIDRDLPQDDCSVFEHVRECDTCSADMDECRAAVWEYAHYEETLVLPHVPPPAHGWPDLRAAMQMDDSAIQERTDLISRLAKYAGRLVVEGAVLGGLAFAALFLSRLDRRPVAVPSAVPTPAPRPVAKTGTRTPPATEIAPPLPEPLKNTEVRVFAALHRMGADLGDPVEVNAGADGKLLVGGTGLAPERQAEIRAALAAEPKVTIRFADPPASLVGGTAPARISGGRSPIEAGLRAWAGSRAAYEELSNRALDESDAVLARAHALQTLAQRFAPGDRGQLHDAELATLQSMEAEHRAAFDEHARALLLLMGPPAKALGAPPAAKPAAGDLLDAAQRMDQVLSAIFGAARTDLSADQLLADLSQSSAMLAATLGGRP